MKFQSFDLESAPEPSQKLLEKVKQKYDFIPNLLAKLAASPPVLKSYLNLSQELNKTSFTPTEQEVLLLSLSAINNCEYCVAAHTTTAQMNNVDEDIINAIRKGVPLDDDRLEALRKFAQQVVEKRGFVTDEEIEAFVDAGFQKTNVLEVILAVSMKTLSNYANHIMGTELDEAFEKNKWTPPVAHTGATGE